MAQRWTVTYEVFRKKGSFPPHFDRFSLDVSPDEYVLDGIERIWAFNDRSLVFSHTCHHSTCGACGMRVNGLEKLTCITPIHKVTRDGGIIRVEPLKNFPIISDLSVDMSLLYQRMEAVGQRPLLPIEEEGIPGSPHLSREQKSGYLRLADCIECGLCMSACPISATTPNYLGPAALAGAHQHSIADPQAASLVDHADGVWRCHSAFECTSVCPSNVDPGWRIMDLRKHLISNRLLGLFRR